MQEDSRRKRKTHGQNGPNGKPTEGEGEATRPKRKQGTGTEPRNPKRHRRSPEIAWENTGADRKSLEELLRDSEASDPRERVQETQGKCKTSEEVSHFPAPSSVVEKQK